MAKLVVGCGYVGRRLARSWRDAGNKVWVTTRSTIRSREFEQEGFSPIILDVTSNDVAPLPQVDTVVFAVGFDRSQPHGIQQVYVDGLQRVVDRCPSSVQRFIYVSSTGVYGDAQGEWVDEQTECVPIREGGKACLAAENLLRSHPVWQAKTIVLRLAGIYGPGRLPYVTKILQGEPLAVAADGLLNLIHVDDIVRIVCQAERQLAPPELLCVSDGHPVLRREFYESLARLLKRPVPDFEPPVPGSPRAERARSSKKISNDRLVQVLSPNWAYPSYREGLKAIVSAGDWS